MFNVLYVDLFQFIIRSAGFINIPDKFPDNNVMLICKLVAFCCCEQGLSDFIDTLFLDIKIVKIIFIVLYLHVMENKH